MKKIIGILIVYMAFFSTKSNAQIQKNNMFIGGDIAGFNLDLGGSGTFQATIDPKLAFFIKDKIALGAYFNFGLFTANGAGTTIQYGAGALVRYYIGSSSNNLLRQGRLFFEGTAGIQGVSHAGGANTNGLGIGIGPGYTYFVTSSIGLETLLKYNGIVGFGSQPYSSNLNLGIGFQIYLPGRSAKRIINNAN